jgi:hypothetical protein
MAGGSQAGVKKKKPRRRRARGTLIMMRGEHDAAAGARLTSVGDGAKRCSAKWASHNFFLSQFYFKIKLYGDELFAAHLRNYYSCPEASHHRFSMLIANFTFSELFWTFFIDDTTVA